MEFQPFKLPNSKHVKGPAGTVDKENSGLNLHAQGLLRDYLANNSEEYCRVRDLRKKGWENSQGDEYFKKQRQTADAPGKKQREFFYQMMKNIALDLDKSTGALTQGSLKTERVLDMCAAPGGFVNQTVAMCPSINRVRAMSLPVEEGGHEMRLENNKVNAEFRDITMLAGDIGITEQDIPENFPDRDKFTLERIFKPDEKYDLVFCDGQVLRTHKRSEWRERNEADRLQMTQLALGLKHLSTGGTMVILMHTLDTWRNFKIIYNLRKIADICLYKHHRCHSTRSSFYIVAKAVQAESSHAKSLVEGWKERYRVTSFGSEEDYAKMHQLGEENAQSMIEEFGAEFIKMGTEIWKTQADGLERAPFIRGF